MVAALDGEGGLGPVLRLEHAAREGGVEPGWSASNGLMQGALRLQRLQRLYEDAFGDSEAEEVGPDDAAERLADLASALGADAFFS